MKHQKVGRDRKDKINFPLPIESIITQRKQLKITAKGNSCK